MGLKCRTAAAAECGCVGSMGINTLLCFLGSHQALLLLRSPGAPQILHPAEQPLVRPQPGQKALGWTFSGARGGEMFAPRWAAVPSC